MVSRALFNNGQKVIHETLLMCTLFWQALVTSGAPFGPRSSCETAFSVVCSYVGSVSKSKLSCSWMLLYLELLPCPCGLDLVFDLV